MQRRGDKIKKVTSEFDSGHLTIQTFISSLTHLVVNTLSVNYTKVRPNGTFSHFVRRNGIRQSGIIQSGKTPIRHCAEIFPNLV